MGPWCFRARCVRVGGKLQQMTTKQQRREGCTRATTGPRGVAYASSAAPAAAACLLFIVLLVAHSEATKVIIILGFTSTMSSHVRNTTPPILRATLTMYLALALRSSAVGAGPCEAGGRKGRTCKGPATHRSRPGS